MIYSSCPLLPDRRYRLLNERLRSPLRSEGIGRTASNQQHLVQDLQRPSNPRVSGRYKGTFPCGRSLGPYRLTDITA